MLGFGFGPGSVATVLAGGVPLPIEPPVPTIPPADWRMPATVTTSTGLAGLQSNLQAAQQSASSKSRPSITVPIGATEWIEWQVAASDTYLALTFMGGNNGTVSVTVDGVDQGYAPQFPEGHLSGPSGKRQGIAIPPGGARTIRLTCIAGASERSLAPLLHKMPARGPADSYIINGASREDQGMPSAALEAEIMAQFPTRDPIVFNWARSGQRAGYVAGAVPAALALYRQIASYALVGSIIGNDVTGNRPYDVSEKPALDAAYDSIGQAYTDAGIRLVIGNISYRNYAGDGSKPATPPTSQTGGALEYNDVVVHPMIQKWSPAFYDAALCRARVDEYQAMLVARSVFSPSDPIHGGEDQQRKLWVRTAHGQIYAGSSANIASETERRLTTFESQPTGVNDNEALYALTALAPSAGRDALFSRYTVAHRQRLYADAVGATQNAETAKTQASKDAAMTAVLAANSAGYTPASDLDALVERIARVAVVAATVIGVNFKTDTDVPGWNNVSRTDPNLSTVGAIIVPDLIDENGKPTGLSLVLLGSSSAIATSSTPGAQGAAAGAPFPDPTLLRGIFSSAAANRTFGLMRLGAGEKVRIQGANSTTRTTTSTTHWDVPGRARQTIDSRGNVSNFADFFDVAPTPYDDAGTERHMVQVTATRGSGYLDVNALRFVITAG